MNGILRVRSALAESASRLARWRLTAASATERARTASAVTATGPCRCVTAKQSNRTETAWSGQTCPGCHIATSETGTGIGIPAAVTDPSPTRPCQATGIAQLGGTAGIGVAPRPHVTTVSESANEDANETASETANETANETATANETETVSETAAGTPAPCCATGASASETANHCRLWRTTTVTPDRGTPKTARLDRGVPACSTTNPAAPSTDEANRRP